MQSAGVSSVFFCKVVDGFPTTVARVTSKSASSAARSSVVPEKNTATGEAISRPVAL
jgi:hypothetical protein